MIRFYNIILYIINSILHCCYVYYLGVRAKYLAIGDSTNPTSFTKGNFLHMMTCMYHINQHGYMYIWLNRRLFCGEDGMAERVGGVVYTDGVCEKQV